jgi:hypothetical protein
MTNENEPPLRARRWVPPPDSGRPSPPRRSYRFAFKLIGIPVLAVAAVFLFRGVRDRFELPQCDSDRAKQSLIEVLKQLKLEPVRYDPIKTVSNSKEQVVCSALLPLPDGGNVAADFTFYWDGSKANMRYSIARKAS